MLKGQESAQAPGVARSLSPFIQESTATAAFPSLTNKAHQQQQPVQTSSHNQAVSQLFSLLSKQNLQVNPASETNLSPKALQRLTSLKSDSLFPGRLSMIANLNSKTATSAAGSENAMLPKDL